MFYRNRIKFYTKTKNFSNFSLVVLFILTFLLIIFNKTDYVVVNKIKSINTDLIAPFTKIITSPINITTNVTKKMNNLLFLKEENARLKEEILRLKKWQSVALKNQNENKAYRKLLNSTTNEINIIKTASVISKSPSFYTKTITINAGLNHGVLEDLVVINERGLVGKIISSTKFNSKVILINDQNSSIPVKTALNDFHAIVKGTNNGKYLTSAFIKGEILPKVGDILLTTNSANTFPKDLIVGKIVKVENNNFLALPYVDFNNINYVQIINIK